MISYVGRICFPKAEDTSAQVFEWKGVEPIGSNLARLSCPYGQLKVLLEQALAIAYFVKFMGLRCHEVVNEFIEELNNDIAYRFSRNYGHTFQDNFKKIYQTLNNLVKFNRGGNWTEVDIALVSEFLFDGTQIYGVPSVWTTAPWGKKALIPFLMFMNKNEQAAYREYMDDKTGIVSFDICSDWTSERFADTVEYYHLHLRFHPIGRSFSAQRTPLDHLTNCPILGLLSHFDWSTTSIESTVGIISELCFHEDITRHGISLSHLLAYCFRSGLRGIPRFDISGYKDDIYPIEPLFKSQLFDAFLAFVNYCTAHRGMQVVDKMIIAKAFGSIASTKQQRESVDYLRKNEADASADDLRSFKQVMGAVEALQLISQKPTLITAQTGNQVTGATEDATKGDDKNQDAEPGQGSDPNQSAEKKDDEPEPKEGNEDDNSEPSPDDDGAEDLPSDDTTGAGEDLPDDQGSDTPPAESGDSGTDPSTSAQPDSTPEVNTSDDKGIPFEFVTDDSATVDSVLFREEMDKFLANVLTNPPKCLSPQDVDTLTALKRFWLHCLSIDTIKGIVEACIRLPKTVKSSLRKSTEIKQ